MASDDRYIDLPKEFVVSLLYMTHDLLGCFTFYDIESVTSGFSIAFLT